MLAGGPGALPWRNAAPGDASGRFSLDREARAGVFQRSPFPESSMPVSKKRKKAGKPAARKPAPPPEGAEHPTPEVKPVHPLQRAGRPSNPFVTQQQARRGAQRGR